MIPKKPINRMIAARIATAVAAEVFAYLFAWTAVAGTDRPLARTMFALIAIAFAYWSYLAARNAVRLWRLTRRFPNGSLPASPQTWAAFMAVVEQARQIEADGNWRAYQRVCEKYFDGDVEEAGMRVNELLKATGRYDDAWPYIDEMCGIVGGASDVASAVLVRDVIDPADFDLLTGWWVKAGLPLEPLPATTSAGR